MRIGPLPTISSRSWWYSGSAWCRGRNRPVSEPAGPDPCQIIPPITPPIPELPTLPGLVLLAGTEGVAVQALGDIVIHAPMGTIEAPRIDLRALGSITFSDFVTVTAGDFINLCADLTCEPFGPDFLDIAADPLRIGLEGPLSGNFALFAMGSIFVTSEPVPSATPEPGTGVLAAIGLALLAARRGPRT